MRIRLFQIAFAIFLATQLLLPALNAATHERGPAESSFYSSTDCTSSHVNECLAHHTCACHASHFLSRLPVHDLSIAFGSTLFSEYSPGRPLSPELEGPFQPPRA